MRFIFKFFFLSLFFMGCITNTKNKIAGNKLKTTTDELIVEPDTIYNVEIANRLWQQQDTLSATVIDTACIKQRQRAKTDIKKGKLVYFHTKTWYEWKEMAALLAAYAIEFKDYEHSCFGPPPGFEYDCYQKEMRKAVYTKIGEKEMDSLWNLAERNFVLKHPDSIYMKDGIDVRTKYLTGL